MWLIISLQKKKNEHIAVPLLRGDQQSRRLNEAFSLSALPNDDRQKGGDGIEPSPRKRWHNGKIVRGQGVGEFSSSSAEW